MTLTLIYSLYHRTSFVTCSVTPTGRWRWRCMPPSLHPPLTNSGIHVLWWTSCNRQTSSMLLVLSLCEHSSFHFASVNICTCSCRSMIGHICFIYFTIEKQRERERLKCFHAKLVNSIYFSWRIPLDDGVINDLRENPAHRYSFVCNAMLHICNTQDTDRCVQSTVTCYELTNKYEVYIHKCIILNLVVLLENIQGIPKIKN